MSDRAITQWIGYADVLFITLDTLRYDVARNALEAGETPNLAERLPGGIWEERHSPASFTYAAHHAFFAGFLPTPLAPGNHPRLFATRFPGSRTLTNETVVFDTPDIVSGFARLGYRTICIGGVSFFDRRTPLGRVLPDLFEESYWSPKMGPASPDSTAHQVSAALDRLQSLPSTERVFLFLNVSAMHSPHRHYLPGATHDSSRTQAAALAYVDRELSPLLRAFEERGPTFTILTSDHGTTFGEDGYRGHRIGHPLVWTVPYAHFMMGESG
jgi:hypothetical protein